MSAMLTASVRYLEEQRHLIEAVPPVTGSAAKPTDQTGLARR